MFNLIFVLDRLPVQLEKKKYLSMLDNNFQSQTKTDEPSRSFWEKPRELSYCKSSIRTTRRIQVVRSFSTLMVKRLWQLRL